MQQEINPVSPIEESPKSGLGKKILYGIFLGLFLGFGSSAFLYPILTKILKTSDQTISTISVVSGFIIFFILGYVAAEFIENFIKRLLGFIYPQYNSNVQGNQTAQLTKRISLFWPFIFLLLIIAIPGVFIFTKYTDFAAVAFVIGWIIFFVSMSKKFKNKTMETSPPIVNKPIEPSIQTKTKLGKFESLVIILSIFVGLFEWTFSKSTILFISLQKYILFIWFILSFNWLYKRASLFEGSNQNVQNDLDQNNNLTTGQKILITISGIIFAPIVGTITVILWRIKSPKKARKANVICMTIFVLEFLIGFVLVSVISG